MRFIKIALKALIFLIVVVVIGVWLVLSSPFFEERRQIFVANILSKALDQPVLVTGTQKISLGRIIHVTAAGVEVPSMNIEGETLAKLDLLTFEFDVFSYFAEEISLDTFVVEGLALNLLTDEDGKTTWTPSDKEPDLEKEADDARKISTGLTGFVSERTIDITDVSIVFENRKTGFIFDFELSTLQFQQVEDGEALDVSGMGTVNGETFDVKGYYPNGAPFTTLSTFSSATLSYNGQSLPSEAGRGYTGKFELEIGELSDLFDVLGLDNTFKGSGRLSSQLTREPKSLKAQGVDLLFEFDDGKSVTLDGAVEDLFGLEGVDLSGEFLFYREGEEPAKAKKLKDFRLVDLSASVKGDMGNFALSGINVGTNVFVRDFNELGPISVGRIFRTPEGKLSLEDIHVQGGPLEQPFLSADGDLDDLLGFEGLDLDGEITLPASLLLKQIGQEENKAFGQLDANFSVTDESGEIAISQLSGHTSKSDVWEFGIDFELAEVRKMKGMHMALNLAVPDSGNFVAAFGVEPVDIGPLSLFMELTGEGADIDFTTEVTAGESDLNIDMTTRKQPENMFIRGAITSPEIRVVDIKNAATWGESLISFVAGESGAGEEKKEDDKPEEPFVLETDSAPEDDKPEESFVVAKEDDDPDSSDSDAVPLTKEEFLHWLDVDIDIDLAKITGQAGLSKIVSEVTVLDAIANVGPLEFSYGGGYFNTSAQIDLDKSPNYARVNGRASGWELGPLLKNFGVDMDARGKPSVSFNLGAVYTSVPSILSSLSGSADVKMGQGAIATSLLELAGLGIFKWLFSEQLSQGYTQIGCIDAPIRFAQGKITTEASVLETTDVQLLLIGGVDLGKKLIDIRGEPRALGKPLARAPFPFTVKGALDEPKFKILFSGTRYSRSDGAETMPTNRAPCVPDILQLQ